MILNQSLEYKDLPDFVQAAFQTKFGAPTKDELPNGMELYKFNEYPSLTAPGSTTLSPWWSPYKAYKHDAGWAEKVKIAQANGVSIKEWGRLTSAIKENWNSLSYLLVITLQQPVCGFFGGFSQMVRIDPGAQSKMGAGEGKGGSKNLPGGGTQFYIPNLTVAHVTSWNVSPLS